MEVEFEYEGVGRVLGVNADVWMWCGDDAVGFCLEESVGGGRATRTR